MKSAIGLFFISIIFFSCSSTENKASKVKPDFELEVINDVLPHLIPKHPPCMLIPLEGEEDFEKRLKVFYDSIEAKDKKIEIITLLQKIENRYLEALKKVEKNSIIQVLRNAPKNDRRIDSTMLQKNDNFQIVFVKEERSKLGRLSDCNTFGQFHFSRVGFNKDSTRAAFKYFIDNGSCLDGKGGLIYAEFKKGKWRIKK